MLGLEAWGGCILRAGEGSGEGTRTYRDPFISLTEVWLLNQKAVHASLPEDEPVHMPASPAMHETPMQLRQSAPPHRPHFNREATLSTGLEKREPHAVEGCFSRAAVG